MIRVAVADDHPIVLRGLKQVIECERDLKLEIEASSASELLEQLRAHRCDVVVLDVSLPDQIGLDILPDIWELREGIPVLILSVFPPAQFAARAFRAGAAGYLTKESAPEELVQAIRAVAGGRRYINAASAEAIAAAIQSAESPSLERLSPRERQVLRLYASGKTLTEIAEEMGLSLRTVSTYKARILEKLKLDSNAALVSFALQHKLAAP